MFSNINALSNINSRNKNRKTCKSVTNCSSSLNPLIDEQEKKVNKKFILNHKIEYNNNKFLENNLNINEIEKKKNNINNFESKENGEYKNNLENLKKYKGFLNSKINLKEEEKVMDNKKE